MKLVGPIWLASRSPRRRDLLTEAGIEVRVRPAEIDDGVLRPGRVSPQAWVAALAYLKARWVADLLRGWRGPCLGGEVAVQTPSVMRGVVLGADTVCVAGDQILGQPRDADDARAMLRMMRNAEHKTLTGVCLVWLESGARMFLTDHAVVRVGQVSDEQIEQYIASGDWRGKAGAYNLSERIAAGWPIECIGDPATVMGLPIRKLKDRCNFQMTAS